eukprot:IDg9125t1
MAPAVDSITGAVTINFTLSDFARLIAILTYNGRVRAALLTSGRELTRPELENRTNPYAFWETVVVPVFNEAVGVATIDYSGVIDGIDTDKVPTVERTCADLRKYYSNARAQFTVAYERWSRSGQNDSTRFDRFCLRAQGANDLSVAGKRSLIMFLTFRCGEPGEAQHLTRFTLRSMPSDIAVETGHMSAQTGGARTGANGRHSGTLLLSAMESLSDNISNLTTSMASAMRTRSAEDDEEIAATRRYSAW